MKTVPILYKDNNIIAVHKPCRMMVSEVNSGFRRNETLISLLEKRFQKSLYPINWIDRAGSGIVVVTPEDNFARIASKLVNTDAFIQKVLVLVKGSFSKPGDFQFPLRDGHGQTHSAITRYRPVWTHAAVSLLEVMTETRCSHQIRRHFSRRCANVIGDKRYGQGKWNFYFKSVFGLNRIFYHVSRIELSVPFYTQRLEINCPMPEELLSVLRQLAFSPTFLSGYATKDYSFIIGAGHLT